MDRGHSADARAVGKAKAMDLILTGRMMDAAEAERTGLVARVVPAANVMEEAMKVAETIASMSLPAAIAAKEAVNRAFETPLAEGIKFERRRFHALFSTVTVRKAWRLSWRSACRNSRIDEICIKVAAAPGRKMAPAGKIWRTEACALMKPDYQSTKPTK
jgi:hypothetical protein